MPLPSDRGLAGLTALTTKEVGKKVEGLQKTQISLDVVKEKSKDPSKKKASPTKTSPSPATHTCKYA